MPTSLGTKKIRRLRIMIVCCLVRAEVSAALWRKHRIGELGIDDAATLIAEFESDYFGAPESRPRFLVLGLPSHVLDEAARLVAAHGLRAYDGLQMAAGKMARDAEPSCQGFACFDEDFRRAAAAEGFSLVPANERDRP